MNNELVSIITPSYNCERFISETIKSVLAQTYQNWEMIIIDDCSTDNSVKIIEEYRKSDNRIKLIKLEKNYGQAIARNKGIEEAKGRYIAFLDADDLWKPEKLEKQIEFMKENNLSFTYSAYELIDEEGNYLGIFVPKKEINYKSLLKTNDIGCLTAIYDAKKLGKMYMPLIKKRGDYGLWLNILKKIGSTKGILEPLAVYRIRRKSVSSNKIKVVYYQWRVYRKVEKLSLLESLYYFVHYAYHGFKKYK